MKKKWPPLLTIQAWVTLTLLAHFPSAAAVQFFSQCPLGGPLDASGQCPIETENSLINILAGRCTFYNPKRIRLVDGAMIWQTNWRLVANSIWLTEEDGGTITARGKICYCDPTLRLAGRSASYRLSGRDWQVDDVSYQLVGSRGQGYAHSIKHWQERYTSIKDGIFTTCDPNDVGWHIKGSTILHDSQEEIAEIWDARFMVSGVPILYSPYWRIPIGNRRRSGFIAPSVRLPAKIGANRSLGGLEFSLPFYWNIAPNFDALLTPNYIGERGLQGKVRLRYLVTPGLGTIAYEHLNSDHLLKGRPRRFLHHWEHNGIVNDHWYLKALYTRVSDANYFSDLSSEYGLGSDSYTTQEYETKYADREWYLALSTRDFQLLRQHSSLVHRLLPKAEFFLFRQPERYHPLEFSMYGQAAKLKSSNSMQPSALRLHAAPKVGLRLPHHWGDSYLEGELNATQYQQCTNGRLGVAPQVRRYIPKFKAETSMLFRRKLTGSSTGHQILQPQLSYIYIPFSDQRGIANYDSALRQPTYESLFSAAPYSGLDWIPSTNQLSLGVTTRLLDPSFTEWFNFSIGKIHHFTTQRTGILEQDKNLERSSANWGARSQWLLPRDLSIQGELQAGKGGKRISLANALLEYRPSKQKLIQLNYQFIDAGHLQVHRSANGGQVFDKGISQIGITAGWAISRRWALFARYSYDFFYRQSARQQVGFQYGTCCWEVAVNLNRSLKNFKNQRAEFDSKISLDFTLRGLGKDNGRAFDKMILEGGLPYQRPLLQNDKFAY